MMRTTIGLRSRACCERTPIASSYREKPGRTLPARDDFPNRAESCQKGWDGGIQKWRGRRLSRLLSRALLVPCRNMREGNLPLAVTAPPTTSARVVWLFSHKTKTQQGRAAVWQPRAGTTLELLARWRVNRASVVLCPKGCGAANERKIPSIP